MSPPSTIIVTQGEHSASAVPPHRRPQHLQIGLDLGGGGLRGIDPDLIDQLRFMQEQEATHYRVSEDYLSSPFATVSRSDRKTMCSWSYDIVDACSLDREVSVVGAGYFDRFLCSPSPRARTALVSRREFQLAFITCLIIALKCRAGMQVDSDFVSDSICQKLYGEDEIVRMEADVLAALGWRLSGPSPHEFIGGFLELLPSQPSSSSSSSLASVKGRLRSAARARAEAVALDYDVALRPPSSIAYAALLTAARDVSPSEFRPLDRLAWMRNVAAATGIRVDGDDGAARPPPPPPSPPRASHLGGGGGGRVVGTCFDPPALYGGRVPATAAGGGVYCGPVTDSSSDDDAGYYSDASTVSSARTEEADNGDGPMGDLSPVCAVLDGRFDAQ